MPEGAKEADRRGDWGALCSILNRLWDRPRASLDGTKQVQSNPVAHLEEWREHFERIQRGRGEVHSRVWASVPAADETSSWLGEDPTLVEVSRALRASKGGRAAGEDEVVAELLQYGGEELLMELYRVVSEVWHKAAHADEGLEAEEWPAIRRGGTADGAVPDGQ